MSDGPPRSREAWVPRCVVIVGLGVMGGSVAKALKQRVPDINIVGIDPCGRQSDAARRDGVVLAGALADCDLDDAVVVFAVPLDVCRGLLLAESRNWSRAILVMDVASLKVPIMEAVQRDLSGRHSDVFVGAHPMSGSHRAGYTGACPNLFEGADVWLCPARQRDQGAATRPDALDRARHFWGLLGGRVRVTDPRRHDTLMAYVSHLPQLLASALAISLDDAGLSPGVLGPGGRDMTRLAASSPSMWVPLLIEAARADATALGALQRRLSWVQGLLKDRDADGLAEMLRRGKGWSEAD